MNVFGYLQDPARWTGPGNIVDLLLQHLAYVGVALALAAVVAIPLGLLLGHTGRAGFLATGLRGGARAVPTVGLLFLAVLLIGTNVVNVVVVLAILALPAILVGTVTGIRAADQLAVGSARALGLTEGQILARIEWPLALPVVLSGLCRAVVQLVGTVTIAAFASAGGLGQLLVRGLAEQDYPQMFAGAVLVSALAIALHLVFSGLGLLAGRRTRPRSRRTVPAALAVAPS
ncbi:MAG TPA: ABC transporter permease subunit [Propionibacteriaceae bacterium]